MMVRRLPWIAAGVVVAGAVGIAVLLHIVDRIMGDPLWDQV